MTVAADGLCKKVFAFGVVTMTWLARNGDFCYLILILLQMPVRVHGHIFSVLADAKVEAVASLDLPSFVLFLIHTHFLFPLMKMQPSKQSTIFPYAVLAQGKAQILKCNMISAF